MGNELEYPIRFNPSRKESKPWMLDYYFNGKRIRKSFKTQEAATKEYDTYLKSATKAQRVFFGRNMTIGEVADIEEAIRLLPYGKNLTDAVKHYVRFTTQSIPLGEAIDNFLQTKEGTSTGNYKTCRLRLRIFFADFQKWEYVSPEGIRKWLIKRGASKTIHHYYILLREFFAFAVRREYCAVNYTETIHPSDLPKVVSRKTEYLSVDDTRRFLRFLEERYPTYAIWFALAFFSGIRRDEINRLKPEYFDIKNKTIILPAEITKTRDTWLMTDIPEIFWAWFGEGKTIPKLANSTMGRIVKAAYSELNIKWPPNATRHSFATYHLSLYRDSAKTSIMLRHRNKDTLWQHYLGGLVSRETAEEYFGITP